MTGIPFEGAEIGDVELLMIPFQSEYSDYLEWMVPPKRLRWRVAVAHLRERAAED